MALQEMKIEPPSEAETAITLFCWFETIATAPHIFASLCKPFPDLCEWFATIPPYSFVQDRDFWVMVIFGFLSGLWVIQFLLRRKNAISERAYSNASPLQVATMKYEKATKRFQQWRILRSFGFVWLREKIMDMQGVSLYDTFKRPSNWPIDKAWKDWIDRIYLIDNGSREYQYSEDYRTIKVRATVVGNSTYLEPEVRPPNTHDIKLLLAASSYFPFWYIRYLLTKVFGFFRNIRFF